MWGDGEVRDKGGESVEVVGADGAVPEGVGASVFVLSVLRDRFGRTWLWQISA
jgi:hypothetical protein